MYPWDGAVEAVTPEDMEFDREIQATAARDPVQAARVARQRGIFFRVGAPRLGELLFKGGYQRLYCGRDTGHLGTGLYFFGTLSAAIRSSAGGASLLRNIIPPEAIQNVFRVVGGPQNYLLTDGMHPEDYSHAKKLHYFGMALLCWPDAVERDERTKAMYEQAKLRYEAARAAYNSPAFYDDERISDEYWEAKADSERLFQESLKTRSLRHTEESTLMYSGPRIDFELVRARQAIDEAYAGKRYHPMTIYMRSIGLDGVIHANWKEFNSGDMGNIWYPEISPG